jgi:chemotaxis protein histidine kinase CheA
MVIDKEILQDYLAEAQDLLTKAQEDTLRLESDPGDTEILASLFRAFHTIKGGAGFMEVEALVNWPTVLRICWTSCALMRCRSRPAASMRS